MEYIDAEEFLKKSREVQTFFIEWWKPNIGDLYTDDIRFVRSITDNVIKNIVSEDKDIRLIPLPTEGQLRKFIEDKINGIVKVIQWHIEDNDISKKGYAIDILKKDKYEVTYHYKDLGEDLLKAYWEVACKIAEKEVKSN